MLEIAVLFDADRYSAMLVFENTVTLETVEFWENSMDRANEELEVIVVLETVELCEPDRLRAVPLEEVTTEWKMVAFQEFRIKIP